jgi:hypothetical protein
VRWRRESELGVGGENEPGPAVRRLGGWPEAVDIGSDQLGGVLQPQTLPTSSSWATELRLRRPLLIIPEQISIPTMPRPV